MKYPNMWLVLLGSWCIFLTFLLFYRWDNPSKMSPEDTGYIISQVKEDFDLQLRDLDERVVNQGSLLLQFICDTRNGFFRERRALYVILDPGYNMVAEYEKNPVTSMEEDDVYKKLCGGLSL